MGDPADRAPDCEHHREHGGREAERLQDDAGIKINIRVELLLNEVFVFQRDALKFHRQLQQRVVRAQSFQHFMAGLADHLGARVVVAVDAMAEAHQAESVVFVLSAFDVLADALGGTDLTEHVQHRLVRAPMRRAPQRGDAGGDAGIRIGPGRPGQTHGGGGGVLLVIGMQNQNPVNRTGQHRVHFVLLRRVAEHQLQQVFGIRQRVARHRERTPERVVIGIGPDGRHFGNQPVGGHATLLHIVDIGAVMVEGGQRADHADHDRHRVGAAHKALVKAGQLFMQQGVAADVIGERLLLLHGRQLAVEQQIADLHVIAAHRQVLNRIAAMQQNALVAVNKGNVRAAGPGGRKTGVIGQPALLRVQRFDIQKPLAMRVRMRRQAHFFAGALIGNRKTRMFRWLLTHRSPPRM